MAESKMEPRSERDSEVVGMDVDIVARDDVRWRHHDSHPNITPKLYTALSSPRRWLSTRASLSTCSFALPMEMIEPDRPDPRHRLTRMKPMRMTNHDVRLGVLLLTAPHAISHPSSPPPRIPQMSCLRCRKTSNCMTLDYVLYLTSLISTSLTLRRRVSLNMSFRAPTWRSVGSDDTLVKKPRTSDLPRGILDNLRYGVFGA